MYANKLIKITLFLSLAFIFMGCEPAKLSPEISNELEKIGGIKIASVVLVDSKTGKTESFKHAETEVEHADMLPASSIEKITSISVVRVKGVEREDIDENYQFCNYITIDGHTELICKNTERQEELDQSRGIPDIPPELADKLEGLSEKVNNLSFLTLVDLDSGRTKLFKHADYEQVTAALPQSISEIGKTTSMTIINFKQNPCCQEVVINGRAKVECRTFCFF